MNRHFLFAVCYLILFFALVSICGCSATQSHRESPYQPADTVKHDKAYKVGLLCSLTGPAARIGSEQLRTISEYMNQINSKGGIGGHSIYILGPSQAKPIPKQYSQYQHGSGYTLNDKGQLTGAFSSGQYVEFIDSLVYDTNYISPDKSDVTQRVTELIQADVLAILGPTTSSETLQIIPLIENAKIPLISFGENPAITNPPRDWVFLAKPIEALSAIADALKSAEYDRNGIRQYLETRLPRAAQEREVVFDLNKRTVASAKPEKSTTGYGLQITLSDEGYNELQRLLATRPTYLVLRVQGTVLHRGINLGGSFPQEFFWVSELTKKQADDLVNRILK